MPEIVERAAQPYLGIRGSVTMATIGAIADRMGEVIGWMIEHGIEPAGAPFFRYDVIDMAGQLVIEVGFPVASAVEGEGDILPGVLPAGRYATVTHVGHPDELVDVTAGLLAWAKEQGLRWNMTEGADGEHWACRLEIYKSDPRAEPDMGRWETELAFLLEDR